jgi:Tol biopolymer transport system component
VSLADVARLPFPGGDISGAKHYFNHLLVSPDGSRFEFLHRWGFPNWRGATRMLTAAADGSDVRVIDHSGRTSHFIWRDPRHILAWSWHKSHGSAFYLFEDKQGGKIEIVGKDVMPHNGHCTYLPGNEWILNDTYPQGRERLQKPYLYHVSTGRRMPLGHFHLPPEYRGEWRCDTHPRFSPDGRSVVIDSAHEGQGRQLYLIDISGIVG